MSSLASLSAIRLSTGSGLQGHVEAALAEAILNPARDLTAPFYGLPGMSGRRYRQFINHLVRITPDPAYLEVGSWAGSTLCSAIFGNTVRAVAIDNWSEFGGPKAAFHQNVQSCVTADTQISVVEGDFRAVDYASLDRFNIYLFDGPHERLDQYDGLALALPALTEEFVFIVDDWNWDRVRSGTLAAIKDTGLSVIYSTEIRTTLDDTHPDHAFGASDWHNGYFIAVLRKPAQRRGDKGRSGAKRAAGV